MASLVPLESGLETTMTAIADATGRTVTVSYHPAGFFWRRWAARISDAEQTHNRTAIGAIGSAYARWLLRKEDKCNPV